MLNSHLGSEFPLAASGKERLQGLQPPSCSFPLLHTQQRPPSQDPGGSPQPHRADGGRASLSGAKTLSSFPISLLSPYQTTPCRRPVCLKLNMPKTEFMIFPINLAASGTS